MSPQELLISAVRAWRKLAAHVRNPGRLKLGPRNVVGPRLRIARGAILCTGANVSIGADITAMANVTLGDDCVLSSSIAFIGNDHEFDRPEVPIREQTNFPLAHIVLEGDNLIGFGSILLGNVRVGKGAVVGAGSLVTGDLEPGSVSVGRPARYVRQRGRGTV